MVPDVLHFKGSVSYEGTLQRFTGDIKLKLTALNMNVDGKLVIGTRNGSAYFAIYLGVELPAGIPLWSTGLAIYGMEGLFALQMKPDKHDDEQWYAIGNDSYYHRPPAGITDLAEKWVDRSGSLGFGAGITIGTVSDNGYAFSGRMLLVLVFPGPILIIEGNADLLKERSQLRGEEPLFRAVAVLDSRAGNFLIGLDAQYRYDKTRGRLIDIHGNAEAFFSLNDASLWHLYLGEKEPREKRIRAELFNLFEADAYLMLDAHKLATGAWVGYEKHWNFWPLRVTLEAWIEGNTVLSWKPPHLYGDFWLHGKAELSVFGFGLGLSIDARVAADVFDPFTVLADLRVGINLPWPLPDFNVNIGMKWGPETTPPPLPLPLKEIAIEHSKVTTSWPLPRGKLLFPIYDEDNDGYRDQKPAPITDSFLPDNVPVVPIDCRPHITFGRHMNDDAMVAVNDQPGFGVADIQPGTGAWERIGDPSKDPPKARSKCATV